MSRHIIPQEVLESKILLIRGQRVMLDETLARVYGVTTARLNQQYRRNKGRFPEDFAFQLTAGEFRALMMQNATSNKGRGGRRKEPVAFTEHGAIMAASVLNSPLAVRASVLVVRSFVKLRSMLGAHKYLARRLDELEKRYDAQFKGVFDAIKALMQPPDGPEPRRITGFKP